MDGLRAIPKGRRVGDIRPRALMVVICVFFQRLTLAAGAVIEVVHAQARTVSLDN